MPRGLAVKGPAIALLVLLGAIAVHGGGFSLAWRAPALAGYLDSFVLTATEETEARWGDYARLTAAVRELTPPDSLIVLPPQRPGAGPIGNAGLTDFFVYPRRTAGSFNQTVDRHSGPVYTLRLPRWQPDLPGTATPVADLPLGMGQLILVRERTEAATVAERDFHTLEPTIGGLLLAGLKLTLITLSGFAFARRWRQLHTAPGLLASSFLLGSSMQTVVFIVLGLVGVQASEAVQLSLLALLAIAGLLPGRGQPSRGLERVPDKQWPVRFAWLAVLAVFALLIAKAWAMPLVTWDACAIWGMKARTLFATGTLREVGQWGAWPEYPPLFPVLMAQLGVGGEPAAKLAAPLIAICGYGVLYEWLAASRLPGWSRVLLPALLLTTGQVFEHASIAYANLTLAVYVLWAMLLLTRWLYRPEAGSALPAMLALSGGMLARPDGEVYVVYALAIAAFWLYREQRSLTTLWVAVLPVGIGLLWKALYVLHIKSAQDYSYFGVASQAQYVAKLVLTGRFELGAIGEVIGYVFTESLSPKLWGVIPLAASGLYLLSPRATARRYPVETCFIVLAMVSLIGFSTYLGPAWGNAYYFAATYPRLYMVIVPLMLVVVLLEVDRRTTAGPR